ncbi:MAG TPA: alpha-amylase family protein [Baekduia sp.]|nr:alpha-amylase family protein [Baekduia sp.]
MRLDQVSDQWWKNGVIYCLDAETFLDTDGDGVGDLAGIARQIDYLAGLGVTCLWLMPFQPSPNRDDGYDVADYYGVDPRLGTLGDFVELVRTATNRGLRVVVDFVLNHTSDQHPWFQEARRDPHSPRRDWYVWRDEPSDQPEGLSFPGRETSNWAFDEEAGQYYLHRFYSFQPDLNIDSEAVREEIARIMGYWLALGVAGFRMDAIPALLETAGLPGVDGGGTGGTREWLRELRQFVTRRRGDAMLLGEANVDPQQLSQYFGDHGDMLHMELGFLLNQHLWLALARGEAEPLEMLIRTLPALSADSSWATFLRNHDELTLDKLTVGQREEIFAAFGSEPDMQLYGHGLRRRAASMLGGDGARLRLAWSLLFALPGTPIVFYGDEIGMGENLAIPDRYAVRSPMQWSPDPHGGFTKAQEPVRPVTDGDFSPQQVNVHDQRRDPGSLLRFMQHLILSRRERPEFGWGAVTLIESEAPSLLCHRCDWQGSTVIAIHNLAGEDATATLELGAEVHAVDDVLEGHAFEVAEGGRLDVALGAYGYLWLLARRDGDRRLT